MISHRFINFVFQKYWVGWTFTISSDAFKTKLLIHFTVLVLEGDSFGRNCIMDQGKYYIQAASQNLHLFNHPKVIIVFALPYPSCQVKFFYQKKILCHTVLTLLNKLHFIFNKKARILVIVSQLPDRLLWIL